MRANWTTLGLLALLILLVAAVGFVGNTPTERFAIDTMISLVFVIGLSIFSGNSGVLSFGHAGFAAIGGYAAAWITIPLIPRKLFLPDLPAIFTNIEAGLFGGLALGIALAALAAMVIGIAVIRLNGIAASIATLAWLVIVYSVFSNTQQLTKGTASLVGLPLLIDLPVATAIALSARSC